MDVVVTDPIANAEEVEHEYGLTRLAQWMNSISWTPW
jgi:hypothetical protein